MHDSRPLPMRDSYSEPMSSDPVQAIDLFRALSVARRAAREAGDILMAMLHSAAVREKSARDLVTDADVAAQQAIERMLTAEFPDHAFVGEEESAAKDLRQFASRPVWVVDPLDGTANYVHGLSNFAVSIALVLDGRPVVGVVFDPVAEEMFTAIDGHPPLLNDRVIKTTDCTSLSQALIAASFPPNIRDGDVEIDYFVNVLVASQSVRRLGSAALNLCFVACGRLDGYWAQSLRSWDIAAGVLIARAAGVHITARDGSDFSLTGGNLTAAATKPLHRELLAQLTDPGDT